MRLRQSATVLVVAMGLGGAVAFGGCGSSSDDTTNGTSTESKSHEEDAMTKDAMKDENKGMKDEGDSMKDEGSSGDHMEG